MYFTGHFISAHAHSYSYTKTSTHACSVLTHFHGFRLWEAAQKKYWSLTFSMRTSSEPLRQTRTTSGRKRPISISFLQESDQSSEKLLTVNRPANHEFSMSKPWTTGNISRLIDILILITSYGGFCFLELLFSPGNNKTRLWILMFDDYVLACWQILWLYIVLCFKRHYHPIKIQ